MRFWGEPRRRHGEAEKIGVLLVNLGTPDAPTTKALRKYLRQFLSDPRVVESPRWKWLPILYGIVLPFRSPRSAAAYRKIWTKEGSPLMQNCLAQQRAVADVFADTPVSVSLGMSYGSPSIAQALRELAAQHCRRIVVLPMYPQYAGSTTGSVFVDVTRELARWRAVPHLRFIAAYGDDERYITALADSILEHWKTHERPDKLLFSFHGTPLKMLTDGDPYHCLCHKTARLTAQKLDLRDDEWMVTFQSRFGRDRWLSPPTDETLQTLAGDGARHVQVVCPGFSADCLETLEEIAGENCEYFLEGGGESFSYIPALNASSSHIDFLTALIRDNIGDWLRDVREQNVGREAQKRAADEMSQKMNIEVD